MIRYVKPHNVRTSILKNCPKQMREKIFFFFLIHFLQIKANRRFVFDDTHSAFITNFRQYKRRCRVIWIDRVISIAESFKWIRWRCAVCFATAFCFKANQYLSLLKIQYFFHCFKFNISFIASKCIPPLNSSEKLHSKIFSFILGRNFLQFLKIFANWLPLTIFYNFYLLFDYRFLIFTFQFVLDFFVLKHVLLQLNNALWHWIVAKYHFVFVFGLLTSQGLWFSIKFHSKTKTLFHSKRYFYRLYGFDWFWCEFFVWIERSNFVSISHGIWCESIWFLVAKKNDVHSLLDEIQSFFSLWKTKKCIFDDERKKYDFLVWKIKS